MSQTEEEKLNGFHRQELRGNLNIKCPWRISNKCAYEKCNSNTIGSEIRTRPWELLGHVRRMDGNVPAHKAMIHYFSSSQGNTIKGRPRTTTITTINEDIIRWSRRSPRESRNTKLRSTMDDSFLKTKQARDREGWRQICRTICAAV